MFKRYISLRTLKNSSLRALLIADALILIAVAMLAPIYAVFVKRVGGDIFDAGLTAAALSLGAGITSLVAGKYADGLKNKRIIIVWGYFFIGIGFLLYTIVNSVWSLTLVQLALGLIIPLYSPAYDALFSEHLDHDKEAEEWGSWEAMAYFAASAGALVGGAIAKVFNFKTLFVVMALLCVCSALYVLKLPKRVI